MKDLRDVFPGGPNPGASGSFEPQARGPVADPPRQLVAVVGEFLAVGFSWFKMPTDKTALSGATFPRPQPYSKVVQHFSLLKFCVFLPVSKSRTAESEDRRLSATGLPFRTKPFLNLIHGNLMNTCSWHRLLI